MHVAITQESKLFPTGVPHHHIHIFPPISSSHPPFLHSKALSITSLHLSLCFFLIILSTSLPGISHYIFPIFLSFYHSYLSLLQILSTYQQKCHEPSSKTVMALKLLPLAL